MRMLIATLCLVAACLPAAAISRYNSTTMSCAEVKDRIRSEGAVILRWRSTVNPSLPRFGRYVDHNGYCEPAEFADFASVPTADTKSCPVRECKPVERDDFFEIWRLH